MAIQLTDAMVNNHKVYTLTKKADNGDTATISFTDYDGDGLDAKDAVKISGKASIFTASEITNALSSKGYRGDTCANGDDKKLANVEVAENGAPKLQAGKEYSLGSFFNTLQSAQAKKQAASTNNSANSGTGATNLSGSFTDPVSAHPYSTYEKPVAMPFMNTNSFVPSSAPSIDLSYFQGLANSLSMFFTAMTGGTLFGDTAACVSPLITAGATNLVANQLLSALSAQQPKFTTSSPTTTTQTPTTSATAPDLTVTAPPVAKNSSASTSTNNTTPSASNKPSNSDSGLVVEEGGATASTAAKKRKAAKQDPNRRNEEVRYFEDGDKNILYYDANGHRVSERYSKTTGALYRKITFYSDGSSNRENFSMIKGTDYIPGESLVVSKSSGYLIKKYHVGTKLVMELFKNGAYVKTQTINDPENHPDKCTETVEAHPATADEVAKARKAQKTAEKKEENSDVRLSYVYTHK